MKRLLQSGSNQNAKIIFKENETGRAMLKKRHQKWANFG